MTDEPSHLLDPHELAELGTSITRDLPLDLVDPNPNNPRRELPEIDLLADNILRFGLLQPVIVRRASDRYELLGGHRRLAAVRLLRDVKDPISPQWKTISAVVRTMGDEQSYLTLISAQVHSRAWRPREEASALDRLASTGLTLKQIGERLNRTESWTSKRLRVYADSILSGFVQSGQIPASVAEELLLIQDSGTKRAYVELAVKQSWSMDRARGEVRALRLDKMLAETARRARELLMLLSSIDVRRLPPEATKDLWTLQRRIVALGRGQVVPSIAEAQKAAGINPDARSRRTNSTRRTRRRTMPPPA